MGDEFVAQFTGEEAWFDLAHDDVAAGVRDREETQRRSVDRHAGDVRNESTQAVGEL